MLVADPVMRAKQPCLEIREGDVNHRQVSVGSFGVAIKNQGFVRVAKTRQAIVALRVSIATPRWQATG